MCGFSATTVETGKPPAVTALVEFSKSLIDLIHHFTQTGRDSSDTYTLWANYIMSSFYITLAFTRPLAGKKLGSAVHHAIEI